MKIGELVQDGAKVLSVAGVELPDRTAQWLWLHATKMPRHTLLLYWQDEAEDEHEACFRTLIKRRANREPLQYITGEAEFFGLLFHVDHRVLIPRPETELLVENALQVVPKLLATGESRRLVIVDVGTGSGAISVAIAHSLWKSGLLHRVRIIATDISGDALTVAKVNADTHHVLEQIEFICGSYLSELPADVKQIDVLLSNPPYIGDEERESLQPEVVRYEPHAALFAKDGGMRAYKDLLREAKHRLARDGAVLFEVGMGQSDAVSSLLMEHWPSITVKVLPDMQGIGRVVSARNHWKYKGCAESVASKWWKEAIVYQIYPRSFLDTNGDGIGDLRGIISKLDYLAELGVNVLWLCPIYDSPNDDNGYDIREYRSILGEFGTMADFEELLAQAHGRGLKVLMDLVVNHTSDEHPWFVESKSAVDNPKRGFYFWRQCPNNWVSVFSGSAWEREETTGEYYLHVFSRKQPDLNWNNQAVREEVYDLMRFWLDKGIDGFRMDVINFISKDPELPDAPNPSDEPHVWGGQFFLNGPRIHEYLREMNERVLSYYDVMTVGETPDVTPEQAALYTAPDRHELNMVFHFEHMDLDSGPGGKWDPCPWSLAQLKDVMSKWQTGLHGVGWNSLYWNNHDQPRVVSRFGNDKQYRVESAKALATFLHMLEGTPYIYQGEELGMTNVRFPSIEDYRDIEIINMWRDRVDGRGDDPQRVLEAIYAKGRDNARTPMQWTSSANAGFTTGIPWIAVNPNYGEINAEEALRDENSVFHYYKKLIALRKSHPVIVHGRYELLLPDHEEIYAYARQLDGEALIVMVNFSAGTPEFVLPEHFTCGVAELLIANYDVESSEPPRSFVMRPYEARVYRLPR